MLQQQITLRIFLAGEGTRLEQRLRSLPVPDGIALMLEVSCPGRERAEAADILIFNGLPGEEFQPGRMDCLERVLCVPLEAVTEKVLSNPDWTALWPDVMSDAELAFRFRQVLLSARRRMEAEVTRTYLDTLVDSMPDLVWFKNVRGAHLMVNDAFCRAVGKTKQQCEGRGHYYIWDLEPDEYAKGEYVCLETEEEVIRRRETCEFDEMVKSRNGLRQFKTYKSPLLDRDGKLFGTVGIAKDVTDLQNSGRELEVILSGLPFATLVADEKGSVVQVNAKFCEYFHVTVEQMLQQNYESVREKVFVDTEENLPDGGPVEFLHEINQEKRYYRAQQHKIRDIFGNHFGVFFLCQDITTERELQNRLVQSANTDFLTGLHNRRYFYKVMGEQDGKGVAGMAYFDLDNFKKINDTYGHQAGDKALLLLACLLKEAFPDELITRLGGDEFVVAFLGVCEGKNTIRRVADFIRQTGEVFRATEQLEVLSVSAGLACGHETKVDIEALLSQADKALYEAKSRGKAQYVIYGEA